MGTYYVLTTVLSYQLPTMVGLAFALCLKLSIDARYQDNMLGLPPVIFASNR